MRHLPQTLRAAFVIVVHGSHVPTTEWVAELANATSMPIELALQGTRVEPGRIYVTQPGAEVAIRAGELLCSPSASAGDAARPIDSFLRSLAADSGRWAIGVVLSGSGNDGSEGLRAIRAHGGVTLAQAPVSARFAGMPQSAIDTAEVDYCLDLPELAQELVRLSIRAGESASEPSNPSDLADADRSARSDFRELVPSLESQPLAERLAARGLTDLHTYLALLDSAPQQAIALLPVEAGAETDPAASERVARLEEDLAATREYLHLLVEAHTRAVAALGRSKSPSYGGLGLGLSLVRRLVELHGGSMRVDSAASDRGPSFTVTFPFGTSGVAPDPARFARLLDRPGHTKSYAALSGVRVLVIDDDRSTREAVLEVLHYTGANVTLASSVAEGLIAYRAFDPHVIVCEIGMGQGDGYAFIREVRAREAAAHQKPVPALALTARTSPDDKRAALAAGYQRHLTKPIDVDRLRDAVLELTQQ